MNEVLVQCGGVSFCYAPERPVLDGVDFELRADERIGLVGANGSGKTTFLYLIVGLLRPTAGEIEAFGRVRREESDFWEVRRRAGLLFEDAEDQLFCPTVAEDVAFGPLNLGKSRDEALVMVDETLESLGLSGYQDRIAYRLSAGEKRLVSLATVLAMRPEVLLLDDPVGGLDEGTVERIVGILNRLDLPMIVVSHDWRFLNRVTNKAVHLKDGNLRPCELEEKVVARSR